MTQRTSAPQSPHDQTRLLSSLFSGIVPEDRGRLVELLSENHENDGARVAPRRRPTRTRHDASAVD